MRRVDGHADGHVDYGVDWGLGSTANDVGILIWLPMSVYRPSDS